MSSTQFLHWIALYGFLLKVVLSKNLVSGLYSTESGCIRDWGWSRLTEIGVNSGNFHPFGGVQFTGG